MRIVVLLPTANNSVHVNNTATDLNNAAGIRIGRGSKHVHFTMN